MSTRSLAIADLDRCLFCGVSLTDESRTREHVFPRWLQQEYRLSDQELVLLNGSTVRYGQLLVPACQACNNVHASQLEHRIQQDVASPQDMYVWLLKLQLGVMHWETAHPASQDRRHAEAELPIIPSDAFDIGFLHSLFDVLKRPDPQFVPDPLGSVFSLPARCDEFFYSDKLFQHPLAGPDAHNYSASCIVVHGRLLEGPNAIAGEWGHNPLPWPRDDERPGPACYCGRAGCIETWLSGPGLARDHASATGDIRSAPEIAAGALAGDGRCEAALRRYEERLARSLASVINVLDPDVVVLGGGLSNLDRLYDNVPRLWGPWVFSDRVDTRLVRNVHGDSGGVRGAAWLWD